MKVFAISRKIILEYLREPLLLGLIFAFPVILLFFYYIAFGESSQGMAKHLKIMVHNQDEGVYLDGEHQNLGHRLIAELSAAQFEGSPIFDVREAVIQNEAEIALREQKAALLLVIPTDFSNTITSVSQNSKISSPTRLSIVGFHSSDLYIFAKSIVDSIVDEFIRQSLGREAGNLDLRYVFVPGTGTMSDFEFGVPGLIVFGIMFLTISTAMTMVREEVNGTLKRLRLAGTGAGAILLGVTGAQFVIAVLLVPFIFGCAMLMGFRGNGSILLAIFVGIILSLSAVGLGLLTACFARNDGEAANLSSIIGVMMEIVSGAMYPMPEVPIATIAGRTIQIYDLLPPAHASEALRRVLIYGDFIESISYEIFGLSFLSFVILAAGIGFYQKIKLR